MLYLIIIYLASSYKKNIHTFICYTNIPVQADIQLIADQGEAEVTGNDLDIMGVNQDITNFYPMQIDFQLIEILISSTPYILMKDHLSGS